MQRSLDLSDENLLLLGEQLGGCDFTDVDRRRFLSSMSDLDVQAAPGSGKTTLLVAKLRTLLHRWEDTTEGICVLSHTNAARQEVETRLTATEASRLLSYPHYIGTITAFVHRFIALPYLRGLGWKVTHVDDDVFAARSIRRLKADDFLWNQRHQRDRFIGWAKYLSLANDAKLDRDRPSERMAIIGEKMPGRHTRTRQAFEVMKASICAEGVFRFDDMAVFANRALEACPVWANRLASRYPMVLVDEAQDTSEKHLALVERVFSGRSVIQQLGDSNQTIYETGRDAPWVPREGHVDLRTSHRFGTPIADFTSKLTVRCPQHITGSPQRTSRVALITFEEGETQQVIPCFAAMCGQLFTVDENSIWALASVHRPGESKARISLQDYCSTYRAPSLGKRPGADTLHAVVRIAATRASAGAPLSEQVRSCARGFATLLRLQGVPAFQGAIRTREIWDTLNALAAGAGDEARRVTHQCVLGQGLDPWAETKTALVDAVRPIISGQSPTSACKRYLQAAEEGYAEVGDEDLSPNALFPRVRLGSVASVKGQTHDATLVVQTTIRGTKDVKTALEVAVGIRQPPKAGQTVLLQATTNIFVGATRPRTLLCLALPSADLSRPLRDAVDTWGWSVVTAGSAAPSQDTGPQPSASSTED